MKRFISILLVLMLTLFVVGCGANDGGADVETSGDAEGTVEEGYPNKPINVIVSFSAGGNTDIAARILLPYVEAELGVPLNVINKPGGGGWTGWTEFLNAEKDGYTIGYINTPNLMTGYLNPEFGRDNSLDDFELISNHVLDYGAIAVRADDERFETIEDLIAYAKENDVTATTTGYAGDDHIAQLRINDAVGTNFVPVHQGGTSEMLAAVIGGHVDVYFDNVGSVATAVKNGELRALAVMAPDRSQFLPDVPTLNEAGLPEIVTFSARGLSFAKGVDEEKVKIVIDAFEKALNNPEQIKKIEELGYMVYPISGDEYREFLEEDEKNIIEIKDVLEW
ncbi:MULTISPECIES: tripartite tricarboxylate transporter substrate binding protein [unclassified Sedimentibacter]|uniref:tripartite tricarboxylate transporter substrate binding protein n=1 Tax=unclassified Sedimentibacter TaxID=2649220 RepID=UPI0027E0B6B0|nr:tripartite tricarboxylate transporter substrate binding protein [Sedimentibacter sp. MB35-C1]WMJ76884.1 tripartite tricarboxylate transporter substrate binding protein [Sedimentibacter sp. MB35-C1]